MRVLGAVLAGGRSSRFGSDKALATWRGRRLIDSAWDALADIADARVICGREHRGLPWVADRPAPDLGPLGGLCAALNHAWCGGYDRVVSIGCDTPIVPPGLIARLALTSGSLFLDDLPIIGGWPASLAPLLDVFIVRDTTRSMRGWGRNVVAEAIAAPPICNVNVRADLDRLEDG